MATTQDCDGNSLLSNTFIVLTGDVGDGQHQREAKPHIVFGGTNKGVTGGRWRQVPNEVFSTATGILNANGDTINWASNGSFNSNFPVSQYTHADLFLNIASRVGSVDTSDFSYDEFKHGVDLFSL